MPPAESAGGIDFMHNNVEKALYIFTKLQPLFLHFDYTVQISALFSAKSAKKSLFSPFSPPSESIIKVIIHCFFIHQINSTKFMLDFLEKMRFNIPVDSRSLWACERIT